MTSKPLRGVSALRIKATHEPNTGWVCTIVMAWAFKRTLQRPADGSGKLQLQGSLKHNQIYSICSHGLSPRC